MKLDPKKHRAIIEFKKFLVAKGVFYEFQHNCEQCGHSDGGIHKLIDLNRPTGWHSFVDVCFIWRNTEEGGSFWADIDNAWEKHVETYGGEW